MRGCLKALFVVVMCLFVMLLGLALIPAFQHSLLWGCVDFWAWITCLAILGIFVEP